ncbi:MAG: lipopolysaccharide kinase InaA family protein [Nitrosomonadales bacterium]|nr:lipopolysaccharide kinase InaA family protein [Nitrosomonadales bacterium]
MKTDSNWHLAPNFEALRPIFGSLDAILKLQGEHITGERISNVIRVEYQGIRYYVKRYYLAGKGLRRFFGKPRIQSEWENLQWFTQHGIPTAPVVAYGMKKNMGLFQFGALITQEIPNTQDLADIARNSDSRLQDRKWISNISHQVANAMRVMHANGFIHNDFKWRNLLVNDQNQLFLIDCPLGAFWSGKLFEHRVMKEFSTLDRVAKYVLSNTQRLRFYLQYVEKNKLNVEDKAFLRKLSKRKNRRTSSFSSDQTD